MVFARIARASRSIVMTVYVIVQLSAADERPLVPEGRCDRDEPKARHHHSQP
jgi:hypothetical protein